MFAHHHHPAAVVLASGEDSLAYLQSQWSSQLDWKGENQATYGLRLNRKGRILADGFILRKDEENFLIVSYDCPAENLIALLEENVVADDVEFEDRTNGHEIISLWGGDHEAISSQFAFALPKGNSFAATEFGLIFWGRKTETAQHRHSGGRGTHQSTGQVFGDSRTGRIPRHGGCQFSRSGPDRIRHACHSH